MRCPKCHYLGFEPEPRCKNCGYDFSFSEPDMRSEREPESAEPAKEESLAHLVPYPVKGAQEFDLRNLDLDELPAATGPRIHAAPDLMFDRIAPAAVSEPVFDGPLRPSAGRGASAAAVAEPLVMPPPAFAASADAPHRATHTLSAAAPAPVTTELPLFVRAQTDTAPAARVAPAARIAAAHEDEAGHDEPLIAMSSAPRAPLSVRRATPDPARLRASYAKTAAAAKPAPVSMNLLDAIDSPLSGAGTFQMEPAEQRASVAEAEGQVEVRRRLMAASVDVLLLLALNAAVVWFTLDVCALPLSQLLLLPPLPMATFLLLLDGGYLVLFTAACGQTLGKMAAGIRVVGSPADARTNGDVSLAQATGRELTAMLSVAPLGLGLWFALSGQGRALHDRLAHTRVVRA